MTAFTTIVCFSAILGVGLCLPSLYDASTLAKEPRNLVKRSLEIADKIKSQKVRTLIGNETWMNDAFEEYCPGKDAKFNEAAEKAEKCVDKIDEDITVCQAITTELLPCLTEMTSVTDECFPPESAGIANLGVQSVISVVKFICESTGETTLELLNECFYKDLLDDSSEEETTATTTKQEESNESLENKIGKEISDYKSKSPTVDDICGFVTSVRDDIQEHLKESCKNPKTKAAFTGLYEAIVAPCKKNIK